MHPPISDPRRASILTPRYAKGASRSPGENLADIEAKFATLNDPVGVSL